MKEGDQKTRRAQPNKKREPNTKLKKKIGSKKGRPKEENFVKKQVSLSILRAYLSSQRGIQ
jgi:hypothetical protein